jgi:prevent-host-death family protein
MRIASLAEVKARLSAYVEKAEKEGPVIITRNGKAVAVIIAPVGIVIAWRGPGRRNLECFLGG